MKNGIVGAILVLGFLAAGGQADERRISDAKLSKLGLASLQVASDEAGMEVRGMGRAFASGAFLATTGTAASGPLSYSFATWPKTPNAIAAGSGFAVSDYAQIFNGGTFVFTANAFGASTAFAP